MLTFSRGPYAAHAMAHLRPKTWEVRRYQLATICKHLGALKLTALTTEALDRYKTTRTAEGAKPRTVNTELAKHQAVMAYARDVGVPCASPKVRRLPEIGRGRVTFWTADQLSALFAAVEREAPDLLPVVTFLANIGCRKGEALACEQAWVDLKRGILTIAPNPDWQPKDNEPRDARSLRVHDVEEARRPGANAVGVLAEAHLRPGAKGCRAQGRAPYAAALVRRRVPGEVPRHVPARRRATSSTWALPRPWPWPERLRPWPRPWPEGRGPWAPCCESPGILE